MQLTPMNPPTSPRRSSLSPIDFHFEKFSANVPAPPSIDWIWRGFLAPGLLTLFTAQWKSGKTTLVAVLLSRLKAGGELLGLATRQARAVILSEESSILWQERQARLAFGPDIGVICKPFTRKPSFTQWNQLVHHAGHLLGPGGPRLLVIDTIGTLFPSSAEMNADCMDRALDPLRRLAEKGVSNWLLHHPAKDRRAEGQAARGTGALPAEVEIVLEMKPLPDATPHDYVRVLHAFSRHEETPRRLLFEWLPARRDYRLLTEPPDDDFARGWSALRLVFSASPVPLARPAILDRWPPASAPPSRATLARWLARAVELGLLICSGVGHRYDP
jgi:hypothetical protein